MAMVEWNSISYLPLLLYLIILLVLFFLSFFYFVKLLQFTCNYYSFSWGAQENNEEEDIVGVLTSPLPCFFFHCLKINNDRHKEASSIPSPQVVASDETSWPTRSYPHSSHLMVLSKKKRK
jgi:hypothetical protein